LSAAALRAYGAAGGARDLREQEADVFRRVTGALRAAGADPLRRARALADNRRLWLAVESAALDPHNDLPVALRAALVSIGRSVLRELDGAAPELDFLIEMNEQVAAGLAGRA
jgi:flagellar biosynthesis regulator FlaF